MQAKSSGKQRIEGPNYVMNDGDIMVVKIQGGK
jgi:ribosome-binding ATPase YchF (GTP1/OBG family)